MAKEERYDMLVIGGGAAGFFGAVNACLMRRHLRVAIIEKTGKWLSKVRVSGGGRCNVTHHCQYASQLVKNYPRGSRFLKKVFEQFDAMDTMRWFEERGVQLKTEADGRVFPVTNSSQSIIDCLMQEAARLGVELLPHLAVESIEKKGEGFRVEAGARVFESQAVLVAVGGIQKADGLSWISQLGHSVVPPVPSLFTFNVPEGGLSELAGISVPEAEVKLAGLNLSDTGPLLVTHWGFSGPAILRLSARGARELATTGYRTAFMINWLGGKKEEVLKSEMDDCLAAHARKQVGNHPLYGIPTRLWTKLTELAGIGADKRWLDLSKKDKNRLVEMLIRCPFAMNGKTTFKEEFVTCGGISLAGVNPATMESLSVPGLYFAGEVLDIDGVTGGFNFQNAWSGAWVAARSMADKLSSPD